MLRLRIGAFDPNIHRFFFLYTLGFCLFLVLLSALLVFCNLFTFFFLMQLCIFLRVACAFGLVG